MSEDRELGRLIDAALGTYADPRPDENLAERVLARLADEPSPRPRRAWLPWAAIALPAAICLLLLVHSGPGTPRTQAVPPLQSAQFHSPASIAVLPHPRAARPRDTSRQVNRSPLPRHLIAATTLPQPLPKLNVFPTPVPLTPQERALAAYVAQTPEAQRKALAQSERQPMLAIVASFRAMPLKTLNLDAINYANTNF